MAYSADRTPLELTALTSLASDDTIIVGDTSDVSEVAKSITKANLITTLGITAAPVDSVNTQTGAVVLDADDISDAATTNKFTTAGDISKLAGIEASADVTDTANVTAAGALMDSEVTNLAQVKAFDSADYATAAQGATADSAQQPPAEGAFVDGDKTALDNAPTISSGAGAPATTPSKEGDIYVDTTADTYYVAVGTASSADWEANGSGGGVLTETELADGFTIAGGTTNERTLTVTGGDVTLEGGTATKGDVFVADGSGNFERLAVGANGQILEARSTETLGVRWIANSGGSGTVSSGAGAPSSAPSTTEDIYHDTTNKRVYHAFGTSSVSDWRYTETIAA
jgi:hypothetical protein